MGSLDQVILGKLPSLSNPTSPKITPYNLNFLPSTKTAPKTENHGDFTTEKSPSLHLLSHFGLAIFRAIVQLFSPLANRKILKKKHQNLIPCRSLVYVQKFRKQALFGKEDLF